MSSLPVVDGDLQILNKRCLSHRWQADWSDPRCCTVAYRTRNARAWVVLIRTVLGKLEAGAGWDWGGAQPKGLLCLLCFSQGGLGVGTRLREEMRSAD